MNDELRALLTLLGVEGLESPDAWKRVLMVLNHGCVPARHGMPDWGFKLLILDDQGRPEWFGRCSWTSRVEMERETTVLEALTADPYGRERIPEVRTGHTPRLFLQISRHLGVRAYGGALPRRSPRQWSDDVAGIVDVSEALMARATVLLPELRTHSTADARQSSVRADLARITAAGVSSEALSGVAAALDRVRDLPFTLQHGDLWPANVLRRDGRWWLIDFAECGFVWVPLYDVFHMLHNAPPAARHAWYGSEHERVMDEWSRTRWSLLRRFAGALGLSRRDVGTCLVFYLVHLAAYRLRPGVPLMWSTRLLESIERVGRQLAAGAEVEHLLPWGTSTP